MVYYNALYNWVVCHPLYNPKQPFGFFHCSGAFAVSFREGSRYHPFLKAKKNPAAILGIHQAGTTSKALRRSFFFGGGAVFLKENRFVLLTLNLYIYKYIYICMIHIDIIYIYINLYNTGIYSFLLKSKLAILLFHDAFSKCPSYPSTQKKKHRS